jgi:hypothetical protein
MWFVWALIGIAVGVVATSAWHAPTAGTLSGALAGAVVSFTLNTAYPWFRVRWIASRITFVAENRVGHRVTGRVRNRTGYVLRGAVAYVTIDHELNDIAEPTGTAFTNPRTPKKVTEDRLCWSLAGNPVSVDIYPDEAQSLDIAGFEALPLGRIEIPSEQGWSSSSPSTNPVSSRVFLRGGKTYSGKIRIVSADARGKDFWIRIDPSDLVSPVKVDETNWWRRRKIHRR